MLEEVSPAYVSSDSVCSVNLVYEVTPRRLNTNISFCHDMLVSLLLPCV